MACGEYGLGRMAEPMTIVEAIEAISGPGARPPTGCRALVTSGPTREAIDPVRYLSIILPASRTHAARRSPGLGRRPR